jgi:hypothetical protein
MRRSSKAFDHKLFINLYGLPCWHIDERTLKASRILLMFVKLQGHLVLNNLFPSTNVFPFLLKQSHNGLKFHYILHWARASKGLFMQFGSSVQLPLRSRPLCPKWPHYWSLPYKTRYLENAYGNTSNGCLFWRHLTL